MVRREYIPCFLPVQKFLLFGHRISSQEELVSRIAFLSNKFMPHWKSVSQPHTIRARRAVLTLSLLFLRGKETVSPLSPTWSCRCIMVRWGRSLTLRRLHLRFSTLVVLSLPRNVRYLWNWIELNTTAAPWHSNNDRIEENGGEYWDKGGSAWQTLCPR